MMIDAFELAERLQTMVFVMSDLDLGMNLWMSDPFPYPEEKDLVRGKVLGQADLERVQDWGRYKDVDGDGIPYRTLPGTPGGRGAYFTRGSGHDEYARYTEDGGTYARNMDRLLRKLATAKEMVPGPVVQTGTGGPAHPPSDAHAPARIGILAYGTTHHAIVESRDQLRAEKEIDSDYLRVRAFPFDDTVPQWIAAHDRVYVVEQNRDGQMLRMLRMEYPALAPRLRSVRHYDGLPIDARTVTEEIAKQERSRG
jgi:2-oxoglutarate ferredoxin oxidoreductase subunit alpha